MRSPITQTTRLVVGVLAILALHGQRAVAQTDFSDAVTLNPPTVNFAYTQFTVTTAGTFQLFTVSPPFTRFGYRNDPDLFLFDGSSSNGAGLGPLINWNNDGALECASVNYYDACIFRQYLGIGNFTLATGLFFSQEANARNNTYTSGYFDHTLDHDLTVRIMSHDGVAIATVPEPASMLLLGAGLAGVIGASRWRRRRA